MQSGTDSDLNKITAMFFKNQKETKWKIEEWVNGKGKIIISMVFPVKVPK